MATIKPFENTGGYTTFENSIIDLVMPKCKPNTWKILCVAIRLTRGWNKESDRISISQFQQKAGIGGRATVIEAIRDAVDSSYLIKLEGYTNAFAINKQYEIETSSEIELVQKQNQTRFRNRTKTSSKTEHTKTKIKKQKSVIGEIPEPLHTPEFETAWEEWCKYRTEIKHTMTERTAQQQLKKLATVPVGDAIKMIEQSIMQGWRGLFELKEQATRGANVEITRNADGSIYV